ncbi:MAG: dihydrodipicolinate synthase family protein, partial [bacterium]
MTARPSFEGVIPPVVTPFSLEGDLDLEGLERQLDWLSGRGLAGVLVLGSTGEAPLMDREERKAVVERAAALKEGGGVLLAGTGSENTRQAIVLSRDASRAGADAVLVVNPSYYTGAMDAEAMTGHFQAVADASPVPILLYSVPKFTGLPIPPKVVEGMARHENCIGIKDSSGDLRSLHAFLERTPPGFQVLTGSPLILGAAGAAGAAGAILAVANLFPELCIRLFEAGRAGELDEMRALQTEVNVLTRRIQAAHGIPGLKSAAELLGGFGGFPRPP